jgi:hypothetical protein
VGWSSNPPGRTPLSLDAMSGQRPRVREFLDGFAPYANLEYEREAGMRQFMMTVMALEVFGATAVTAQAEIGGGAPIRNGDQCFKFSPLNYENKQDGRSAAGVPVRNRRARAKLQRQRLVGKPRRRLRARQQHALG